MASEMSGTDFFCADRGYLGVQKAMPEPSTACFNTTMCHSFGLHLLEDFHLQKIELLVVLSGFHHFHGETKRDGLFSRKHVRRMLLELVENPQNLLNKFYRDCCLTPGPDEFSSINHKLLMDDLKKLDKSVLDVGRFQNIPRVLVIHGGDDRIVPFARGQYLADCLGNASLVKIDNAGHGLLVTHPTECLNVIDREIKLMNSSTCLDK